MSFSIVFFLHMTYSQVESELAGLGQEDRDMFLEDMGVTDEECGLHVTEKDLIWKWLYKKKKINSRSSIRSSSEG